jgi:ribose transport system substrate-binding protein
VDATVDDPAVSAQIGVANEGGGQQLGRELLGISGGKGEIGVVGALNSTIQLQRQKGFTDEVTAHGMTIKSVVDGRNIQEDAQSVAENLLTGNPGLPYAFATGEPALIGLAAAVTSQQRTKDIKVVGWDLSEQAVDAMNAAINLACGRPVPRENPVPLQIVTPENVAHYLYYLESHS